MDKKDKNKIRKEVIDKRLRLSKQQVEEKSKIIISNLLQFSEIKSKYIFSIYFSVNNEVETSSLISKLLKKKKNVYAPSYLKKKKTYVLSKLTSLKDLEKGPNDILQPVNSDFINAEEIEVSIIPGVAFDGQGARIGYGKGVFDRLFVNSNTYKVGLAYDFQILNQLPVNEDDIAMDTVVTETRSIYF